MRPTPFILGVLLPLLPGCGDFKTSVDVRSYYAQVSSPGTSYAIRRTLGTVSGPVSIIQPGPEAGRSFAQDLVARGLTPEAFSASDLALAYGRANIFPVDKLTTGVYSTLDGKAHQVECSAGASSCTVDGKITGYSSTINVNFVGGSIYESNGYLEF